jgi:hypothetical protein
MDQKQQIAERLRQANNVLVTVSNNPSVDQLAACIGLTLALNKLDKHATAVFSGVVPSTIEFLQPEKTIEANTDSLRDFIISLDKTKADKLRYKVEDKVVKIFITPYRTSISEKDLEFSQGDFNVDVVVALGVHQQPDLDQAITSHGRILHDATVVTVNVKPGGELGSINWLVPGASSLSELTVQLVDSIDKAVVDAQIATAFLTGIVAETGRFGNERTTPETMSISAELMAKGANQQLVSTKLEEPPPPPPIPVEPPSQPEPEDDQQQSEESAAGADGTLEISHNPDDDSRPVTTNLDDLSTGESEKKELPTPKIQIDDQGSLRNIEEMKAGQEQADGKSTDPTQHLGESRMILQPPSNMEAGEPGLNGDGYSDPLSLPQPSDPSAGPGSEGMYANAPASANISSPTMPYLPPSMTPGVGLTPPPPTTPPADPSPSTAPPIDQPNPTPSASMGSPIPGTLATPPPPPLPATPSDPPAPAVIQPDHVDNARDAVFQAYAGQPAGAQPPEPIHALNAQPLGDPLHTPPPAPIDNTPPDLNVPVPAAPSQSGATGLSMPAPVGSPPPVPPPMMPTTPQ